MNEAIQRFRLAAGAILAVALLLPGGLEAQAPSGGGEPPGVRPRVPVTIALVERIDDSRSGAVVLRRAETFPTDLILLRRRGATPERLSAAIFTYLVARDVLGVEAKADERISVVRERGPRAWRRKTIPRLAQLLKKLRSTEPAVVRGIGEAPSVTVWLPADYDTGVRGGRRPARP